MIDAIRLVAALAVALALCAILLAGVVVAILANADLTPVAERLGSAATGRAVRAGALKFGWDGGIVVDMDGFHLPGPSWGTAPDMIRIDHLHAVIDVDALLHRTMKFRQLRASGVTVYLERDGRGVGNWRFDGQPSKPHPVKQGGFAVIPADRTQFPTLIDAKIANSLLLWRTSSGHVLRLAADDLRIWAPDDVQPAHIFLDGSYNRVGARMNADTASFTVMRQAETPFGVKLGIMTENDRLDFDGAIMKPLDFDGVRGRLTIRAPSAGDIVGIAGVQRKIKLASALEGALTKTNDHWQLDQATLRLGDANLSGQLVLDEGARFHPDGLSFDLATKLLEVDPLLAGLDGGPKTSTDWKKQSFAPDGNPGATVKLKLKAQRLTLRKYDLADVLLDFSLLPGDAALHGLAARAFGGGFAISGDVRKTGTDGAAWVRARGAGMRVLPLLRSLGVGAPPVDGALSFALALHAAGPMAGTALNGISGAVLASIQGGAIDRHLTELASADLRLLFRHAGGMTPMPCLMAGLVVRDGIAVVSPLQLRAATARLLGGGVVDLPRRRLDLVMDSDAESSGAFALDLPFRISGPLESPGVGLAIGEHAGETTRRANRDLPAELRDLNFGDACR